MLWITLLLCLIQASGIAGTCTAGLRELVPFREGQTATLICTIAQCVNYTGTYPHPVTWTRGSTRVTTGVTTIGINTDETMSNLTITMEKSYNGQIILCSSPAANNASAKLNVTFKPDIRIDAPENPDDVREGSSVSMFCNVVSSNPPPTSFQWTFRESTLSSDPRLSFVARRNASGVYTCSVSNTVGTSQSSKEIDVTYGPGLVSLSPNTRRYDVTEGIDIIPVVSCSAECNPSCTYSWSSTNQPLLNLSLARRQDAGVHTCSAVNKISTSSASITIVVNYPPDISFGGGQIAEEGEDVTLRCAANGVPANYTYHGWYQVSPSNDQTVQSGDVSSDGLIHLSSLSYMHNGIYHCSVSNGVPTPEGEPIITGTIAKLRVNGPFHDLEPSYVRTGVPGSDFEFLLTFFQFSSSSSASTSWFNVTSGELISPSRGNITLESIKYDTKFFSTDVTVDGYSVVATINDITDWDFGPYLLYVESLEQTRIVHLRIDRGEVSASQTTNGWMVSTIILLILLLVCILAAGVWLYRRGYLSRFIGKDKEKESNIEDADQNNSETLTADAMTYDPSVYTPLQIRSDTVMESHYSNLQPKSEHTYEYLKTKNNSEPPADHGVPRLNPESPTEAASLYQNVNITAESSHGNKQKGMPPKPKPKKAGKARRNNEGHHNGAFTEQDDL